jgi:SAM-dependent methyltransferase
MDAERQKNLILDQFTRQAIPFAELPAHSADESDQLLIRTFGIGPTDTVLDVACGPGLITTKVAEVAGHVTGIDITPAMIEQAKARQAKLNQQNLSWQIGNASPLPFEDGAFSAVMTRYSFHHFLEPQQVAREMARVCRPGGRMCVTDVFVETPEKGAEYDRVEKLRDPSHVRGLTLAELTECLESNGISNLTTAFYKVEVELEKLLAASFPNPGDLDTIRTIFREDVGKDRLGLGSELRNGVLWFAFPIVIVAGTKSESRSE